MCMPTDHEGTVISYADFFAATPVQPLPPSQHSRPTPSPTPPADSAAPNDRASTPKRSQQTAVRCKCRKVPAAMRPRNRRSSGADDFTLAARLFVTLSIVVLSSKLMAGVVFTGGVAGELVTEHSPSIGAAKEKDKLKPTEDGYIMSTIKNTMLDMIHFCNGEIVFSIFRKIEITHKGKWLVFDKDEKILKSNLYSNIFQTVYNISSALGKLIYRPIMLIFAYLTRSCGTEGCLTLMFNPNSTNIFG